MSVYVAGPHIGELASSCGSCGRTYPTRMEVLLPDGDRVCADCGMDAFVETRDQDVEHDLAVMIAGSTHAPCGCMLRHAASDFEEV